MGMDIDRLIRNNVRYRAATSSNEEKERAVCKAHDYIILGYTLMNAADILMRRTERIMKAVDSGYRYQDTFEIGRSLKALEGVIRRTDINFRRMDGLVVEQDSGAYDRIRENAFEVIRFVMLLYSRTCGSEKATRQLEAYMRRMKDNGLFSEEEIAGFAMKK